MHLKIQTVCFAILLQIGSMNPIQAQWQWIQKSSLPVFLEASVSFVINNSAYTGTGYQSGIGFTKSFWRYDQLTNSWTQIADFGGTPRIDAVATSVAGLGYVGFGFDNLNLYKNDWWQYNPANNNWTALASYPGAGQQGAVCFNTTSSIYVVSGKNTGTFNNSLLQYSITTNSWFPPLPVIFPQRWQAFAFVSGQAVFIGGGKNNSNTLNDFWKYNFASGLWSQMTSFPDKRSEAVASNVFNGGVAGSGRDSTNLASDVFYEYNVQNNSWSLLPILPGPARTQAAAFTIGNGFYVATGADSGNTNLNDLWLLQPTSGINEIKNTLCELSFNSINGLLNLQCSQVNSDAEVMVYGPNGSLVATYTFFKSAQINLASLHAGIYFLKIKGNGLMESKKIIKL